MRSRNTNSTWWWKISSTYGSGPKSPQKNGVCERFHKTVINEPYRAVFRQKIYKRFDALQTDLDARLRLHNEERPHQGWWRYGKTPLQTLLDSIALAKEKMIAGGMEESTTTDNEDLIEHCQIECWLVLSTVCRSRLTLKRDPLVASMLLHGRC